MRFRTVLEEFEAHFQPVQPGSNVRGKLEWKHYEDGRYRLKISIRDISLPDGSEIDLWCHDSWMMRLTVQNNKAKGNMKLNKKNAIAKGQSRFSILRPCNSSA